MGVMFMIGDNWFLCYVPSQCGLGSPGVIYCIYIISALYSPTPLQTVSGITRTLTNGNLLLGLWFERIPGVVQGTENAISDHPLLHRGVLNIEL
jgi:hypothetical protein